MKITEDQSFKRDILQRIHDREFSERTGVHCSDLCYCLNKQALRRLNPLPLQEHELLLFSLGWSTQRWLTGQDRDEPAKVVDSIIVTCDTLIHREQELPFKLNEDVPWELKATFQSSAKPIEENTAWFHQIMAQCYVNHTTTAFLTRLEIMGNWKSIFGKKEEKSLPENEKPTLHAYRLEFTKEEIEDNWLWMRDRSKSFSFLLENGEGILLLKSAALPEGHEWECGYCPQEYKTLCEASQ